MTSREERIRDKAQQLWEQAGRPAHHPDRHREEAARLIEAEDAKAGRNPTQAKKHKKPEEPERAVDIGPSPEGDITSVNTPPVGLSR